MFKKSKNIVLGVLVVILLGLLSNSVYIIYEDEVGVIKTFGAIEKVIINQEDTDKVKENLQNNNMANVTVDNNKGLHFKIPIIQKVEKYDAKYLTYNSTKETVNTKDKRKLDIQMYAQYRIADPAKFSVSLYSKARANTIMDDRVYPVVIQSANTLVFDEFFLEDKIDSLIDSKLEVLNNQLLAEFGIYVTDIGINRKTFPLSNIDSIENKMTTQIESESQKLLAEGDSAYNKAKAVTDRQRKELIAAAVEEAAIIRANADAESLKIYQESLRKDLEFYQFIQRMDIYKKLSDTTIFLDKDNDLLEYINGY